jgi:hypothetical protein
MKTANLTGALLDYWVAQGLGLCPTLGHLPGMGDICRAHLLARGEYGPFMPSTDWALGGPIIERGQFDIEFYARNEWGARRRAGDRPNEYGKTPLIAAMRAYVASKFGDTVPDDLALP